MHRLIVLLPLIIACGDDDDAKTGGDGAADTGSSGDVQGSCTLTAEMREAGTGPIIVTAVGRVTCPSARELGIAVTLEWKEQADDDTAWSEVQTSTETASGQIEISAEPAVSVICPINATKVYRANATATVDGAALAAETSSPIGPLCP